MLPDLGTAIHDKKLSADADIFPINCLVLGTIEDKEGLTQVVFKVITDETYMGTLIVSGKAKRIAQQISSWGGVIHVRARIHPNERYETSDGQWVIPFFGTFYRDPEELHRAPTDSM